MSDINPYEPPGVDSHVSYRTPKARKTGVLDLPRNKVSTFYLLRDSGSINTKQKELNAPVVALDARGSTSRDHAQVILDPTNSTFTLIDRGSTYGSCVEIENEDGTTKQIFIIDLSKGDKSKNVQQRKQTFLFGSDNSTQANSPHEKITLDFSRKWKILLGTVNEKRRMYISDVIINDGNEIRYRRENFSGLGASPEKDDLIFRHDTLKQNTAREGFFQRTRVTYNSVLAWLGLRSRS
jgi:hypothetical protein